MSSSACTYCAMLDNTYVCTVFHGDRCLQVCAANTSAHSSATMVHALRAPRLAALHAALRVQERPCVHIFRVF